MIFRCSFFAACCLVPALAFSQQPSAPPSKGIPQRSATISFDNLCVAQLSQDQKSIHLTWPRIAIELRTRTVNVKLTRTETRTRTIKVDGRSVPETYTVTVPFTESREVTSKIQSVIGMHEADIPVDQVRAWTLTGRTIDVDALSERLNRAKPVFAYTTPKDKNFEELDPYYASVMVDETLVLYIDTTAFQIGEPQAPAAESEFPAAPAAPPTPPAK